MHTAPRPVDALRRRTGLAVLAGLMLLLPAVAGRMAYLLHKEGDRLRAFAEKQQHKQLVLPARRGSIFDNRGRLLAGTERKPDVFVDARRLFEILEEKFPAPREQAQKLSEFAAATAIRLNLPAAEVLSKLQSKASSRFVVLKTRIDDAEAEAISAFESEAAEAISLTHNPLRSYPLASSMAHVIGFVGREGKGLEGVEKALDEHLHGTDGVRRTLCTVSRGSLDIAADSGREPVDGGHVVLTLDAEIQRIAEEQLRLAVEKFEAKSAVALVMDPNTGDVLAMASLPTYDLNDPNAFPVDARRNRAVTDPVEPGSCFKPFVASGALQERFVSLKESVDCHHGLHFFRGRKVRDTHPQGWLDLKGIIVHSSNIGMGTIADRMPASLVERLVRDFGYGQRTDVGCPGESAGIFKPVKEWSGYSPISISFGQELAVTPIQLITALSAIVNGGELLKPRIVRGRLAADGRTLDWHDGPEVVRRVLRKDISDVFTTQILPSVVDDVTEGNLKSEKYTTLGKTGTAQVPYPNRPGYEPGAYVGSFLGAGPVSDPRLTCIVMVRKPNPAKGYYGRTVAGPAVKAILEQSLEYLGVPPDREATAVRTADAGRP